MKMPKKKSKQKGKKSNPIQKRVKEKEIEEITLQKESLTPNEEKPVSIEKERWDEEQIKKTAKILLHAEKNKSMLVKILDEVVHWMMILVVLFGNLIISTFIVFLSKLTNQIIFYSIVVISAVIFGILVEVPLREIEKLDKNKHFISRLLLPILALLNIYILIGLKNTIEYFTKLEFDFNPLIVGIVYGVFFLMPHIFMWIRGNKR